MTQTQTRIITTTAVAALLVASLAGAAVAPAAATHNGDENGTVGDALTPSDNGILAGIIGTASGFTDRAKYAVFGADDSATENRDAAVSTFNQYNDTLLAYANNRSIHEGSVVQVDCTIDDETATSYIVADYNDSSEEYTSAEAVTSTDRSVDHTVTLEGAACDNAAEEIEYFHDEFASEDKDVTKRYMAEMAGKYAGSVDEPFTGGN